MTAVQTAVAEQLEQAAVAPVHAYLLVGPEGWGSRTLARRFAADVLAAGLAGDDDERARRLVDGERHPDLVVVEPAGNILRDEEVEHLVTEAYRSPVEGTRKVLLVTRFHTANDKALTQLLKVVEEPPASTLFVLLADELDHRMVTIASRCVVLRLAPVTEATIAEVLVSEGIAPDVAGQAAAAAAGDVDRARLLAGDERLALRLEAWRRVAGQLDGTGHVVWRLVGELRAAIDDAVAHVEARMDAAVADVEAQVKEEGLPRGRVKEAVEAAKREVRRARTAELKLGLATLAGRYRDVLAEGSARPADRPAIADAVAAIDEALLALVERNANEALLLQALFLGLPVLGGG